MASQAIDTDYEFDHVLTGQFRKDGSLVREKAIVSVEAVLEPFVVDLLRDECPRAHRLEGLKYLAELGGVGPRKNDVVVPGAGFSININLPSPAPGASSGGVQVLDVTPQAVLDIDAPEYERINADLMAGVE